MKKRLIIFAFILLHFSLNSFSQIVKVEGVATLKNISQYENIKVVFHRDEPTVVDDTVFTDSKGHYSDSLEIGIYRIILSKEKYRTDTLLNVMFFSDTKINDVTLVQAGLTGGLSGVLTKGDYIVSDNIWIGPQDTLRIEPGTKLFFRKNTRFSVFGVLYALGTETDSIYFSRYIETTDDPTDTYWRGISFQTIDQSVFGPSILQYNHISYCCPAIFAQLTSPNLSHLLISDCFDKNNEGVFIIDISKSIIHDIKFINIDAGQSSVYTSGCLKLISLKLDINNIEINGIKNKDMCAISLSDCGGMNLNNLFIHNNAGPVAIGVLGRNKLPVNINNSTLVNNHGLIIGDTTSDYYFNNCIIVNDSPMAFYSCRINSSDIYCSKSKPYFQYNDIGVKVNKNKNGDSCDAYGNIFLDPLFSDFPNGDYSLSLNSPCIDAGNNDFVIFRYDFAGNDRIWDGNEDGDTLVDIGAFEFGAPFNQKIIHEDFEQGLTDWEIQNNNTSTSVLWSVAYLPLKSHSGFYCLLLASSVPYPNSTIITPYIKIKDEPNQKLSFWLGTGLSGNSRKENETPMYSNGNQLIVNLNLPDGTITNMQELLKVQNMNPGWKHYEIDLSDFRGKTASFSFNGKIAQSDGALNDLLFDDIIVGKTDNELSIDNSEFYSFKNALSISPNPASDYLKISVWENGCSPESIKIFDVFGLEEHPPTPSYEEGELRVDVSLLATGVYFVRVGNKVSKFIKY